MLIDQRGAAVWIVVGAYFAGAFVSVLASRSGRKRDRRFWVGTAVVLVFLGLSKQLNLQAALSGAARYLAHIEGWYDYRRFIQVLFLLALALGAFFAAAGLLRWMRRSSFSQKAAATGLSLLLLFIVMRATSLHAIDQWVMRNVAGLRAGWWLELAAITVIGLSALAYRGGARGKQSR
jgi:hypothetical protein